MNWDAISFDWNHIRAFLATVETGSFSAAARALGQTQPTLSRQISGLEESLGVTLFERGTRIMELTDSGAQLLSHVREMSEAALQISRISTGSNQQIEGVVRISSSDAMATYTLPAISIAFQRLYPKVSIEIVPSNEATNLTLREADIAIRHSRPEQPDLIAKRLPDISVSLFASEAYLASLPAIKKLEDLSAASFIGYEQPERLIPQFNALGIPITKDNFAITTTSGTVMYELARKGAGVALLPTVIAEGQLGLRRVLPEAPVLPVPTWLVTHREIRTNRRIRLAFDHLVQELEKENWSSMVAEV